MHNSNIDENFNSIKDLQSSSNEKLFFFFLIFFIFFLCDLYFKIYLKNLIIIIVIFIFNIKLIKFSIFFNLNQQI